MVYQVPVIVQVMSINFEMMHGIFILIIATLALAYTSLHFASPVLSIFFRWARWILFAFAFAYLIGYVGGSTRPFWVLSVSAFLLWFVLETVYYWLAIAQYSYSQLPLFLDFKENKAGDEWPNQKRFISLREWLRSRQFIPIVALKAELDQNISLRSSIYQSDGNKIRLQIHFVPQRNGNVSVCFIFTSLLENGSRIITDNIFQPFGGFYPEKWHLVRKPWVRSLNRLFMRHHRRMVEYGGVFVPWDDDPLYDINDQQRHLERINIELGFLFPRELQEKHGKITWEGRYRVWKELWLLNFLGIAHHY